MPSIFDSTVKFNGEVFARAINNIRSMRNLDVVPYLKRNVNRSLMSAFPAEGGGNKATILIDGHLGGTAQNYDGNTNITPNNVKNYSQTVIVIGRVNSWKEKDFVVSIGGRSELDNQAYQVGEEQDNNIKASALSILGALFDGTSGVLKDRTLALTSDIDGTELNKAITQACGDKAKGMFDVVYMDSYVAMALANLKLLQFAKYTDEQGIERISQDIAYWGNRLVVVDDACGTNAKVGTHHIYSFGALSWEYGEGLVKVPYEMARDAFTAGGVDALIARMRYVLAPHGVSWKGADSIVSPTETQLATATNYELVKDAGGTAINLKLVPFAHATITLS